MKPLVLYDGDCPFCVAQMRRLQRLDWGRRFVLIANRDPARPHHPQLTPEALASALHVVSATGRVLRGAAALRFIGLRLPLAAPFALLLYLPGVLPWAERAYRWVARHRQQWPWRPQPGGRPPSNPGGQTDRACGPGWCGENDRVGSPGDPKGMAQLPGPG